MRQRAAATIGFTLMELLIVLALMSILMTLAMPQLVAYRARAVQAEAKNQLISLAKTEHAFFAEQGTYTDDLQRVGWTIEGEPAYLYGFTSDGQPVASGRNDTAELRASGTERFRTRRMVDCLGIPLTSTRLPEAMVTRTTFAIGAAGNLDRDLTLDRWLLASDGSFRHETDDLKR